MQLREEYTDKISEMVARRISGEPVAQIAEELGVSRQYIYRIFSRLPKGTKRYTAKETLSQEQKLKIVTEYLDMVPGQRGKCARPSRSTYWQAAEAVADRNGIQPETVMSVLTKLSEHHPTMPSTPYYATLQKWRRENSVSLSKLAGYAGCTVSQMREILRGWRHMPLEAAEGIKRHTGLKIGDIYAELIQMDRAESTKAEV